MISATATVRGQRHTVTGRTPVEIESAADDIGATRLEYWGETLIRLNAEWVYLPKHAPKDCVIPLGDLDGMKEKDTLK